MPRIIRLLIGPVCQFAGWFRSLDAALPKVCPGVHGWSRTFARVRDARGAGVTAPAGTAPVRIVGTLQGGHGLDGRKRCI